MESCESDTCTEDEDCGSHGDCRDAHCSCDVGWFGNCCSDSGEDEWGAFWPIFRIVFAIAFFAVAAFALKQFVSGMMLRRSLGCRLILLRLFKSPRNLSVALIVCATFLRGLWLCIDPLTFNGALSRLSDRMLYNIVFPLMYCVYCCVVLVWSGLYQGVTNKMELWSRVYRTAIAVMMVVSFVLGIAFSACQGLRITKGAFVIVAFIAICVAVIFILLGILLFGALLNKHIKSGENQTDDEDWAPRQVSIRSNPVRPDDSESADLVGNQDSELSPREQPRIEIRIELARSRSYGPTSANLPQSSPSISAMNDSSEWSVSFAPSSRRDSVKSDWSEFDSTETQPRVLKRSPVLVQRKPTTHEQYTVVLTYQDKIILRQIIMLSFLSVIIGVAVVGLTIVIAISRTLQEWRTTLLLLFLISAMEFFAYVSVGAMQVLFIFATTIKVKSKENLHFISEVGLTQIALRISRSPGQLIVPEGMPAIGKRLRSYVCSEEL